MVPTEETTTSPAPPSNGVINTSPPQIRWASIVRGAAESVSSPPPISPPPPVSSPPPENLDSNNNPSPPPVAVDGDESSVNAGQPRRPVWNTPSNGVVEPGPVMGGAVAWPALSDATRPVARSWVESARPVGDGSVSTSQAPIIAQPPPQRTANTNSQPHPAANSTMPTRPRSRNRGGGSSSGSGPSQHNNFNQPAAPAPAPLGPPFPVPVYEQPYGMVPTVQEASIRGPRAVGNSHSHAGNDHPGAQSHRNSSRRGNFGSRPRGEGQYHNNQGGRRDQDRRDNHLTPPFPQPVVFVPPPLPPPGTGPFMPGQHMRVFPPQMGGFEMPPPPHYFYPVSPESFRPMAINPGPPPIIFSPMNETPVANLIVKQFDYYFSDENLVKDKFLKSIMDENGWVLVPEVAKFRRVKNLSEDINEIFEALRHSTVVEIQGERVRRRNDWSRWLSSSGSNGNNSGSSSTSGAVTENVLATSMQQVSLDDSRPSANGSMGPSEGCSETVSNKSSSEEINDDSRLTNGEEDASEETH